jgi:ribosomal protein L37AE/L43A
MTIRITSWIKESGHELDHAKAEAYDSLTKKLNSDLIDRDMNPRCPKCFHTNVYYRSKTEDWKCRTCGEEDKKNDWRKTVKPKK